MTDTMEYIRRAHQGDKEARDALVTENMGLIWSIVRRFAGRGYELEDLFQGTRGDPLRQECRANLREGLSSFLAALAEKYVLTRQESSVVVDVEVEADKLKKMPEEAVQTLRLNISPVSLRSGGAE